MGKVFVADLVEGEAVTSYFLVKQVQVRQRRNGSPYLILTLADRTGEVSAVLWDGVEEVRKDLAEGDLVKAQGILGVYQRERQLTLSRLRKATPDEATPDDYLPRSRKDSAALLAQLRAAVEEMRDPHLKRLVGDFLADDAFVAAFSLAPAAKSIHHAVLGGLLEHTASVVGLCRLLADFYPVLDRDLLVAAAMLHDVGKIRELRWDRFFDYTDAGRLLGHIALGASMVEERIRAIPGFSESLARRLLHCILSHHGELEWGSPKQPMTLEALVLHYAEDLDGKVNSFLGFVQSHADPRHPGWTQFSKALDRYLHFEQGQAGEPQTPERPE
jgi:3'-5' exoribonuclease